MAAAIKFKRAKAADWQAINPILQQGEPGFVRGTNKLKIGDGETPWNELPYVGDVPALTTTLDGDEEDKAPSVKAVNKGLDDLDATNKQYVNKCVKNLRAELGILTEPIEVRGEIYGGFQVPEGALPNIYISDHGFNYTYTDTSVTPENWDAYEYREFYTVYFLDADRKNIGETYVIYHPDGYYTMPEGTAYIDTDAPGILNSGGLVPSYNAMYSYYVGKITFQVKVEA